jgi:hypothetical protein
LKSISLIEPLQDLPLPGHHELFDGQAVATFSHNPEKREFASYDGPQSVDAKIGYIHQRGLAGTMWWELSGDCDAQKGGMHRALIPRAAHGVSLLALRSKIQYRDQLIVFLCLTAGSAGFDSKQSSLSPLSIRQCTRRYMSMQIDSSRHSLQLCEAQAVESSMVATSRDEQGISTSMSSTITLQRLSTHAERMTIEVIHIRDHSGHQDKVKSPINLNTTRKETMLRFAKIRREHQVVMRLIAMSRLGMNLPSELGVVLLLEAGMAAVMNVSFLWIGV